MSLIQCDHGNAGMLTCYGDIYTHTWGPLYQHGLAWISAWISNDVHSDVWEMKLLTFLQTSTVEKFPPTLYGGYIYIFMLGLKSIHVSKRGPCLHSSFFENSKAKTFEVFHFGGVKNVDCSNHGIIYSINLNMMYGIFYKFFTDFASHS